MKKTTLTLSLLLAAFPLAIFTAEIAEKDPFLAGLERAERVMHSTSLKPPTKQQLYAHRSDDTPDSRLAYINQENYPHLAHFFKAHPLPADIEQIAAAIRANPQVMAQLQKNYDQRYVRGVWHTQNGFCIKNGDIERQLWALRMQKCMEAPAIPEESLARMGCWS